MLKDKIYSIYGFVVVILVYLAVLILDIFNMFPVQNHDYLWGMADPLKLMIIGTGFSLLALLFFKEKIFIGWLKHIAWWYIPTAWMIAPNLTDDMYININLAISILMTLLFIITLIYAPIMHHRLKKKNQ